MSTLVERLVGPHEWGYRDVTDGSFIVDDTPFDAYDRINSLEAEVATLKAERDRWHEAAHQQAAQANEAEAERDRLRQALNEAAEEIGAGSIHEHCPLMRAILFPSPSETEEGG